jgi:hypothetical protein
MKALGITLVILWVTLITFGLGHVYPQLDTMRNNRTASPEQVAKMEGNSLAIANIQGEIKELQEFGTDFLQ